jgi:hypothetical protein
MRMAGIRRGRSRGWAIAVFALLIGATVAQAASDAPPLPARVPLPALEAAAGERCVEDTPFMRRNHMELLKHQRDRTVHEGIRTTQHSLANCVGCHASRKTGRVTGSEGFCQSCHSYAGVKLDCFECHADKPKAALAVAKP